MTTIVYSGSERTIFSDTLVTTSAANNTASGKVEAAVKVDDLTRLKLKPVKGERPLVMAFAGTIAHADDASRYVLNNLGSWEAFHIVLRENGAAYSHLAGTSVLLVTNKRVITFEFLRNRVEIEKHTLDADVCIGSGRRYVIAAMLAYGASGLEALRVASICDDGTGKIAMAHRIRAKGVEMEGPLLMATDEAGVLELRRSAAKSRVVKKVVTDSKYGMAILAWTPHDKIVKTINDTADRVNRRHKERAAKKKADAKTKREKTTPTT